MHDWTRLDTISSFAKATEDRWAWLHGFIATLPFFAIVCHFVTKKLFFFTFIHLYPPLSTFIGMVRRRRTREAGGRPDGSDCAPLWRKTPSAAADGMPSRRLQTFVAPNLMLL
jgi:hypothetical protein